MSGEVTHALSLLFPQGSVVELRAIADAAVHSGYFDDPDALAAQALALDSLPDVQGIYVTLNEVNPALLARRANRVKLRLGRKDATTSDADILRRRWLPIDLDPVRPSGVSATDEEHQAALARADRVAAWLSSQGFPDPVRADSGNGAHLLYRVDLPHDEQANTLVRQCLATLDALFSDQLVAIDIANFNAARIWKLYGTMSRKGDHTPDRPHRVSRVLSAPDGLRAVPPALLEGLAGALPTEGHPTPGKQRAAFDLRSWLAGHGLRVRSERPWNGGTLFAFEECPFSAAHHDGAFAIQFENGAVFAGCHHQSCGGGSQRWQELRSRYERKIPPRPEAVPLPSAPVTPPPASPPEMEEAIRVLESGDPLREMLRTFALDHEGDEAIAECLILSLASRSVINTSGLHVSVTGESGKGKSHAFGTMLRQVPERFRLKGAMSNKALFYHDGLQPGSVIVLDDTTLSDEMQEVLKGVTTSFREPFIYRTVSRDRKGFSCTIPERCVWWVAKVEGSGDDQVFNRMLTCWIDDSPEQDRRVLARVLLRDQEVPRHGERERHEVRVCRAMWEDLGQQRFFVTIPFASRIRFQAHDNRRNPEMLLDLVKAHALLRYRQRERRVAEGIPCITATREDFIEATRIYGLLHGTTGGQTTKLTRREADLLVAIEKGGWQEFTIPMLQKATGWSNGNIHKIIHGFMSRGTAYSGLLEKCPSIAFTDRTVVSEEESGVSMRRRTNAYTFDRDLHQQWVSGGGVWLDDEGGPHDRSSSPPSAGFPHSSTTVEGPVESCAGANGGRTDSEKSTCVEESGSFRTDEGTHSQNTRSATRCTPVCSHGNEEGNGNISPQQPGPNKPGTHLDDFPSSHRLKGVEASRKELQVSAHDYKPLDLPERIPCCVCGKKESRYVEKLTPERRKRPLKEQDARRLCRACFQQAVERARASAPPLPGVIDYARMEQLTCSIGRCSVCGLEKAEWVDRGSGVKLCGVCHEKGQANITDKIPHIPVTSPEAQRS
ncbi:MAG TPA: hypothetical protein PK069_07345 [Methanolinea sp.]|nr:hypothetical protein [Methanolinea sp.]HQK56073.1 hypothetical protein [Methanolinea sp.]